MKQLSPGYTPARDPMITAHNRCPGQERTIMAWYEPNVVWRQFDRGNPVKHATRKTQFTRRVVYRDYYCHRARTKPVPDSLNRLAK